VEAHLSSANRDFVTLFHHTQHPSTTMPNLLVLIFVVELAVQIVNTIGASTINGLVRASVSPSQRGC
jgi:hypothetical protein